MSILEAGRKKIMKSILFALFVVASVLGAGQALAQRAAVPIIDHPDIAVATSSGKPLQPERVKEAILAAAKAKGWGLAFEPSGKIMATLVVRNKHTVVVEIAYTAEKYSLMYKDSVNMKYAPNAQTDSHINSVNNSYTRGGYNGPVIHPFYNKWVQELKDAIRAELLKA
jgi:hypothetical protein